MKDVVQLDVLTAEIDSYVLATSRVVASRRRWIVAYERYTWQLGLARRKLKPLRSKYGQVKNALDAIGRSSPSFESKRRELRYELRRISRPIDEIEKKLGRYAKRVDSAADDFKDRCHELRQAKLRLGRVLLDYTGAAEMYPQVTRAIAKVSRSDGHIHLYFGGRGGRPIGKKHAHYVLTPKLELYYRREPGAKRGSHNYLEPLLPSPETSLEVRTINLNRLRAVADATVPQLAASG